MRIKIYSHYFFSTLTLLLCTLVLLYLKVDLLIITVILLANLFALLSTHFFVKTKTRKGVHDENKF